MGNTESADYSYDGEIRQRPPPYAGSSECDKTWQQPPYTGSSEVHNYQNMWRQSTYIPDNFSSPDEVISALRDAALESSNLILGIDFTKSNEWTGKYSFNRRSLHAIGSIPNPYEQAISVIGRTLSPFDEDNLIPCFGFASTHDKYVFSFFPDHRPCHGFEEALARYREIVPSLKLSERESFIFLDVDQSFETGPDWPGEPHLARTGHLSSLITSFNGNQVVTNHHLYSPQQVE